MKEYKNIKNLMRFHLSYEVEPIKEEVIQVLKELVSEGILDKYLIKEELNEVSKDETLDLVDFAVDNGFIWNREAYLRKDVLYDLEYYLWEFLNDEIVCDEAYWEALRAYSEDILERKSDNNGWMYASELYLELKTGCLTPVYFNVNYLTKSVDLGSIEGRKNHGVDPNGYKNYNFSFRSSIV